MSKCSNRQCKYTGVYYLFLPPPPLVDEACIEPFDADDIKLESDLTILLWQSSADNVMLLAIGHVQLPDTKT